MANLSGKNFHLVLATVIIACTLEWANHFQMLGFLDRAVFSLTDALRITGSSAIDPDRSPVVVEIDDQTYGERFLQASPLDRGEVAAVLDAVIGQNPAGIIVDLDLSPDLRPGHEAGQAALEQAIATAAAKHIPVVLLAPFRAGNPEIMWAKRDWVQAIMARHPDHVSFANGCLTLVQGASIWFDPHAPALAQVAAASGHGHAARPDMAALMAPCPTDKPAHPRAIDTSLVAAYLDEVRQPGAHPAVVRTVLRGGRGTPVVLDGARLTGRPVFIGANIVGVDQFLTAAGRAPGVVLHAALFETLRTGKGDPLPAIVVLGLDIAFGIVLGLLLEKTWPRYNEIAGEFRRASHRKQPMTASEWNLFTCSVVFFVASIAILVLGLVAILFGAALLTSLGMWLNPAGMLVGLMIHTLLSSREEPEEGHHDHGNLGDQLAKIGRHLVAVRPSSPHGAVLYGVVTWVYVLVIVSALTLVLTH